MILQKKGIPTLLSLLFFLFFPTTLAFSALQVDNDAISLHDARVVVLHSYHHGFTWSDCLSEGIRAVFDTDAGEAELKFEFLDTRFRSSDDYLQGIARALAVKYAGYPVNVVIACDDHALNFMLSHGQEIFPDASVVFCSVSGYTPDMRERLPMTGLRESIDIRSTLQTALQLHPDTEEVAVILDSSRTGEALKRRTEQVTAEFANGVRIRYLEDLTVEQLTEKMPELPRNTLVLLFIFRPDATGRVLSHEQNLERLVPHCPFPIYSVWQFYLGHGIVGGKLVDGVEEGRMAARMALRILHGENPAAIALSESPVQYMFDYEKLLRFGADLTNLPANSVLINQPTSFYQIYKIHIWTVVLSILFLIGVIALLVIFILARKRAESALQISEKRLNLALEATNDGIWDWDVTTGKTYFSPTYYNMLGFRPEELPATYDTWVDLLHPDDREHAEKVVRDCMIQGKENFTVDFRLRTKDGDWKWIFDRGKVVERDKQGNPTRMVGTHADITERKRAQMLIQIRGNLLEYAATHDLDGFLQKALDEFCPMVNSSIGFYHFVDPDEQSLTLQAWSTQTLEMFCKTEGKGMHYPIEHAGVWVDCVREKRPVIHNDYASLTHKKGLPDGHAEVVRELVVPIMREGKIVAILGVGNKPTDYEKKDAELLSYLADVVWEITQRKRVEQELKNNQALFLAGNTVVFKWVAAENWPVEFVSPNVASQFGYDPQDLITGKIPYSSIVHPDDLERVAEEVATYSQEGIPHFEQEYRIARADGKYRWIYDYTTVVRDADGTITHYYGYVFDITDRKLAENALRESEEKFRALGMSALDAFIMLNEKGQVEYWSPAAEKMFDYSADEVMGKNIHRMIMPEKHLQTFQEGFAKFQQSGDGRTIGRITEQKALRRDGTLFPIEITVSPIHMKDEYWSLAIIRDITERKQAEHALREQKQLFDQVLKASQVGLSYSKDRKIVWANAAMERLFGYAIEEYQHQDTSMLYADKEEYKEVGKRIYEQLYQDMPSGFDARFRRKDGSIFWGHVNVNILNPDDPAEGLIVSIVDITDRKLAEQALQEQKYFFDQVLEASVVGLSYAKNRKVVWANKAMERIFGYPPAEYEGRDTSIIYANEEEYKRVGKLVYEQMQHGEMGGSDVLFKHKNGRVFWGHYQVNVLNPDNPEDGIIVSIIDITDRKLAEQALRDREETFRALAEQSLDVIMRFDKQGRHLYVNPIVETTTGIKPEEFIGKTHGEMGFPEELVDLWEEAIGQVFETAKPNRIEFQLPTGLWIDWLLIPEFSPDGKVAAVITSARDITERKQAEQEKTNLEEQLSQAQKMEAIGRLAGGVAHDFNNILTSITGYTEMIQSSLGVGDPIRHDLEEVRKAAERASRLTAQLLAFSRKQIIAPRVIQPNDVLHDSQKMLCRIIGEDIDFIFKPARGLLRIKADPGQLDQIFINLAVNARDAMPDGGKLTIETQNVAFDEEYCRSHAEMETGEYVMLAVTDTGHGMDDDTLEHIFEPFYSTKKKEQGTGLGLSTVYGIVKQNGGFINVYSEPGIGTTFKIYFPSVREKAEKFSARAESAYPTGNETVLLVEDEDMVRKLAKKILEKHGYNVIDMSNGGVAVVWAEKHDDHIDLLLTDVIMPGMNGRELREKLLEKRPDLKVLYMSGYTENVIAHHGVLEEGTQFIQKPFTVEFLTRKIREVLDSK